MLEENGSDVSIANAMNGQEAKDLLLSAEVAPDIIFLDINMPRMNGHEFLAESEHLLLSSEIDVYMLSSSSSDVDKEQSEAYPFVKGYIEKPCPADYLATILQV